MDTGSNSVAVTATEHAQIKRIADSISIYDFASSPSAANVGLRAEDKHEDAPARYILRQTGSDKQILVPATRDARSVSYTITTKTRTILARKGRSKEITRYQDDLTTLVARFECKMRDISSIETYEATLKEWRLSGEMREEAHDCCRFRLGGELYIWQPLGPSRIVMVMSNNSGKRMALFVYAEAEVQRSGSYPGSLRQPKEEDIGELYVMNNSGRGFNEIEGMLCTAIMMVDRTRRLLRAV